MKTFITTCALAYSECPLPFLLGDIDQFYSQEWQLKISTNIVEGGETASFIADDSINEQIQKVRTTAAQAGNYVVGFAPVAVIEREFEDYQFYSADTSPLSGNVAYRGRLKVSQTPVFTPDFLTYENAQFAL
jgi:hypothetical protein